MISNSVGCAAQQEQTKPQVVECMDELEQTVQILIERLASLESRLRSVVKSVPTCGAPAGPAPTTPLMVPLAEQIRSNRQRLSDTYLAVGDLLNRLEL